MPKKRHNGHRVEMEKLGMALVQNGIAMDEGPKRKKWSMHDLKNIQPLTPTQEEMFHAWYQGLNICAHGTAGTGKTFLALNLALQEVLTKRHNKIILIRSAVPSREIGFIPGTEEEKNALYELPYHNIFHELLGRPSSYQDMKNAKIVEFKNTSFLRGLTWDNSIVVLEEASNCKFDEIDTVMTRLGQNTRIILTGDIKQTDLDGSRKMGTEGMTTAMKVFNAMANFECINFTRHDIVRSDIVKSWIIACENIAA